MTWNELDSAADNLIEDVIGQQWYEQDLDEQVYRCQALTIIIECLQEFTDDNQLPDNHATLITKLKAIAWNKHSLLSADCSSLAM